MVDPPSLSAPPQNPHPRHLNGETLEVASDGVLKPGEAQSWGFFNHRGFEHASPDRWGKKYTWWWFRVFDIFTPTCTWGNDPI